jgi:hypothetical protein
VEVRLCVCKHLFKSSLMHWWVPLEDSYNVK